MKTRQRHLPGREKGNLWVKRGVAVTLGVQRDKEAGREDGTEEVKWFQIPCQDLPGCRFGPQQEATGWLGAVTGKVSWAVDLISNKLTCGSGHGGQTAWGKELGATVITQEESDQGLVRALQKKGGKRAGIWMMSLKSQYTTGDWKWRTRERRGRGCLLGFWTAQLYSCCCCWKPERKPNLGRRKVIHLVLRKLEEPDWGHRCCILQSIDKEAWGVWYSKRPCILFSMPPWRTLDFRSDGSLPRPLIRGAGIMLSCYHHAGHIFDELIQSSELQCLTL